jgi:undecaprenyl diphosphate synthase
LPDEATACPCARHVAIIADGNRRWAQSHGLPISKGHEAAADTLKARIHDAPGLGIQELSVYSFSTENWMRPHDEVRDLLSMLARLIAGETPALHQQGVRLRFIGRRHDIPDDLLAHMKSAEKLTADSQRLKLYIALNYGGRAEIIDAAKRFEGSTEEDFRECFYAPEMHDPDLIIRTGGDQRLSNFLSWQSAHATLIFRDEFWPDFTRQSLAECLAEYDEQQRRQIAR